MAAIDEYNKAARIANDQKAKNEDRKAAFKTVHEMDRAHAQEGKTFLPVKGKGMTFTLEETGPSKIEAQREYLRKLDNKAPVGPERKTYRKIAADRLGIPCPA